MAPVEVAALEAPAAPPVATAQTMPNARAYRPAAKAAPLGRAEAEARGEGYAKQEETGFQRVTDAPLSTFSVDTDTASYSNVRRFLKQGQRPPRDAVRVEELVNYFSYAYPPPTGRHPFSGNVEVAACPWNSEHLLARVGLQGKLVAGEERKPANLVFLLDVSGSMAAPNKLPLVKRSLRYAVNQLGQRDRVAIVVYAGASGLALPSTPSTNRERIADALGSLEAGGSTNGGEGIELAYALAQEHFIPGGVNRVILATDGDFNVGVTDQRQLVELVAARAKRGVFLTVLGFGMGNLKDDTLEKLADNGNGSYAYIDDFAEARKVFGSQLGGTLETIAKDVKIQVEPNAQWVDSYRLVGYENRRLQARDFRDDQKDAGEIGAGHNVTAFYELVPRSGAKPTRDDSLMTVRIRYKQPNGSEGIEGEFWVPSVVRPFAEASADFRFASAVAAFGLLLAESPHRGSATFDAVASWASASKGADPFGHRAEFVELVQAARGAPFIRQVACDCPPGDPLCSCP